MNYPNNIKKTYHKNINYGNRGMDLENLINLTNEKLLEKDIAVIYKKPTPIQVVKVDYEKNKIVDAYYKTISTLDYNGIYKGYYIEFDAKSTDKNYLPLTNIAHHQIKHIKDILRHHGIVFLIIMINNEAYILSGKKLIDFIDSNTRKSIPYEYIKENGYYLNYNLLRGIDYIDKVDYLIEEMNNEKK